MKKILFVLALAFMVTCTAFSEQYKKQQIVYFSVQDGVKGIPQLTVDKEGKGKITQALKPAVVIPNGWHVVQIIQINQKSDLNGLNCAFMVVLEEN